MKTAKLLLVILFSIAAAACGGGGGGGTTADTTPPTVSSTSPANSATGVAVNSAITATYSEPMTASTVTAATFTLSGGVTGVVTISGATATITPTSSLAYNTTYTATITTGVKDAAGNPMAAPYTWVFTTGIAPAGTLDTSFNTTGKVITGFGTNDDAANAVAIQTDGKIVVAGTTSSGAIYDFALARYNTDGSLDTTFGAGGKTTTFINGASSFDFARAVVIQTDGKIVVAGNADSNFALVRYNTDGSLDATFGTGGKVTTAINSTAYAAALQTDGKIVVAGNWGTDSSGFVLARYNTDGSLDTTFDTDGIVTTSGTSMAGGCCGGNSAANAVAIQTDGKIVAAGTVAASGAAASMALVRYNTNGSLDTTFDTDGVVTTAVAFNNSVATTVLIQLDGKIVAAGGVVGLWAIYRYSPINGSLETIFASSTANGYGDVLKAAAIQTDGKIVAAGYTHASVQCSGGFVNGQRDFVLMRHNMDGSYDTTFGTGGRIVTPIVGGYLGGANAVAIQSGGEIVVAGSTGCPSDFSLARYLP